MLISFLKPCNSMCIINLSQMEACLTWKRFLALQLLHMRVTIIQSSTFTRRTPNEHNDLEEKKATNKHSFLHLLEEQETKCQFCRFWEIIGPYRSFIYIYRETKSYNLAAMPTAPLAEMPKFFKSEKVLLLFSQPISNNQVLIYQTQHCVFYLISS